VQQFRADSVIDLCRKALIAALALIACTMQIALPNRTTFQLPEAGLVQIADSLIERSMWALQDSETIVPAGPPSQ
jgi:hypothetical protein